MSTKPTLAATDSNPIKDVLDFAMGRQQIPMEIASIEDLQEAYPLATIELLNSWHEMHAAYLDAFQDIYGGGGMRENKYADTNSRGRTGATQRLDAFRIKLFDIAYKMMQYRVKKDDDDLPSGDGGITAGGKSKSSDELFGFDD